MLRGAKTRLRLSDFSPEASAVKYWLQRGRAAKHPLNRGLALPSARAHNTEGFTTDSGRERGLAFDHDQHDNDAHDRAN